MNSSFRKPIPCFGNRGLTISFIIPRMNRIILDIETVGKDFESLDEPVQEYFLRYADTENERDEIRERVSLYPLTAEIVAIGLLEPESEKGYVFFQTIGQPPLPFEEERIVYESGSESDILRKFWDTIPRYRQFITFNGRSFDCPFIMIRSAVNRIKPTKDLMPNRYADAHIDLLDQLTFFGASRRKFSLDMWCRAFGIKSPKGEGITGYDVKDLYRAGKSLDIARYCVGDLRATRELLFSWENYIRFSP